MFIQAYQSCLKSKDVSMSRLDEQRAWIIKYPLIANLFPYIQLCPAHTHAWLTCIYIFESYHATTIYYSCVCHNGPDGIPFGLYANLKDLALPIFVHCLWALLDRSNEAPPGFNHVFVMGLPEKPGAEMGNGVCAYWPGDTRPLSTCGCFKPNPHRLRHICDAQRGFWKTGTCFKTSLNLITVPFVPFLCQDFSLDALCHWGLVPWRSSSCNPVFISRQLVETTWEVFPFYSLTKWCSSRLSAQPTAFCPCYRLIAV